VERLVDEGAAERVLDFGVGERERAPPLVTQRALELLPPVAL
jgi:hypothetical protein